jgi:DNA-binding NtrC family response regulator
MRTKTLEPPRLVLLIGADKAWPEELLKHLNPQDWRFELVERLEALPARLAANPIHAVVVAPRKDGAPQLSMLRACRACAPRTALVVMSEAPATPGLRRAIEGGPSAFLAWPASPDAVLEAIYRAWNGALGERQWR